MDKVYPHYYQKKNSNNCGLICIKIIAEYYKYQVDIDHFDTDITAKGLSIYQLCQISEKLGFKSNAIELTIDELQNISEPLILFWQENHYVVLFKSNKNNFIISDPSKEIYKADRNHLRKNWLNKELSGKAIFLTPLKNSKIKRANYINALNFLKEHLLPYKNNLKQLGFVMFIIAITYAVLPFITRSIIDIGIGGSDKNFIIIVLIANVSLLLFKSICEWIRASISLHIASRIKISIITDYLIKIFSLPLNYIDNMVLGDIIQRSNDQERIQQFISNSAISVLMSIIIILVYSVIFAIFNKILFIIFILSTICYVSWIIMFYNVRKKMDIQFYTLKGQNQSLWMEFLNNFEDIKLNNYSLTKRWKWELLQANLYKVGIKLLNIERLQKLGADFINGVKDITLTFYGAYLVIQGEMTLGTLISIQFIIGQLGMPVQEFINFIKFGQSAFISFLRVNEINNIPEEQEDRKTLLDAFDKTRNDITFKDVIFKYKSSNVILYNFNVTIPENRITAIVGKSGSGKTTILKLLTKVYSNYNGLIRIGENNISHFKNEFLRSKIGAVLQDSKLYNDTIRNNIVLSDENDYNPQLLEKVLKWVNLYDEIKKLPDELNYQITESSKGLSEGQKQRLILARALYKKPKILLLDEGTNAIDRHSEERILNLFKKGLKNLTIIMVSHRLSTVKIADNIVVMDQGRVIEKGSYTKLLNNKKHFYNLFKNQIIDEKE